MKKTAGEETDMRFARKESLHMGWLRMCLMWIAGVAAVSAQSFTTTTVQGTVYLANGSVGSGVAQVSWPAFTTAANQAVAAGRLTATIGSDGFLSVNLAPNQGATPAGLYYTVVYHLSDGSTSTEYWVVPSAAQVALGQVRAQVMPAAQAVQTVSKSYVDQSITELTQSLLTASGGDLSGPLFLSGDPSQPTQAATKHYVDQQAAQAVQLTGGVMSGPLTSVQLGAVYQADQFKGTDFGAQVQACVNKLDPVYGGTCDARNFTGTQAMGADLVISTGNVTLQLPCATIATANRLVIAAGTRNVTLHGCASRGASASSGSQGGTVLLYSGSGSAVQVGDATYAVDTLGFHLDNMVINTTAATPASTQALTALRTQELDLESLYLLGNANQTGMTLDGTGNYTGGTFKDDEFVGFGTAVNGIGHQIANAATTDWLNASTFVRLHIDCPTNAGSPLSGTYGINLQQGDGNTFTGGDIEGCGTALHLGANAQNNTLVGVRNENSSMQVVADAGSSYNNWMTGGTMFTGQLSDNGTRNSFLDTFHRSFNGLNGDWYGSQQDATVTNHFRIGIGTGNERGLLNRYQTDYGYRWTEGLSDATAGEQFYQVLDELNNVYRLSIGQYNHGQASSNNQTVINAAGTGAVVLNGSANAGTGGVIFGSGGGSGATVATINSSGNAQFNGTLQVGGPSTFVNSTTVKNGADAEIDAFLWAGATANQKESFIYKDYTGASQWYLVKDASNNWALNSAVGGLDSFKAYQSTNSGDTYVNASNGTGAVRVNYENGAGSQFKVYGGNSSALYAAFTGTTAIQFPGLAAGSGKSCLQVDNSGYLSNTGGSCGNGTVNAGSAGQVAVYSANGTMVGGTNAVSVTAGGTGATSPAAALTNLGAQPSMPGVASDGSSGVSVTGAVSAGSFSGSGAGLTGIAGALTAAHANNLAADFATQSASAPSTGSFTSMAASIVNGNFAPQGLVNDGTVCADILGAACTYSGTDNTAAIQTSINAACAAGGGRITIPAGTYNILIIPGAPRPGASNANHVAALTIPCSNVTVEGAGAGQTTLSVWQLNADSTITQPTAECPQNPDFTPGNDSAFNYYRVQRGSGIYIYGGTASAPTSNVTIKNLRITGNAAINGWARNPISWDQNLSTGAGSVCNAWDTSHKGIYLQNANYTPGATGWPNDPVWYPAQTYYYKNININGVRVDHFLGELVYSGNTTSDGNSITSSELDHGNGDGTSVGGGWQISLNQIHDVAGQGDEDTEDFVNGYKLIYQNNTYWNIGEAAIDVGGWSAPQTGAKLGSVTVQNNKILNAATNGVALFSTVHNKVTGNEIRDTGWNTIYTSAGITLYTIAGSQAYSGAPSAPASVTVTPGTGGSLAAGTYSYCAAWTFPTPASLGYTACSPRSTVPVSASGTVAFAKPSGAPSNANGWYPYLCLGSSCTPVLQLTLANSNYAPIPLTTMTYTVSALGTLSQTAQTTGQTYFPVTQDVDITGNSIIADNATTWVGVSNTNLPYPMNYPFAVGLDIHNNFISNTGLNTSSPVPTPSVAPVLSQPANLTGQPSGYYPNLTGQTLYAVYTWRTSACESAPSPQSSITMSSTSGISNLFQMGAPANPPSNGYGFNVYVGTASGGPYYLQTSSGWQTYGAPYTMSAGLSTSGQTPPVSAACSGVVANQVINTPTNVGVAGSASGYFENGNIANDTVQNYAGGTVLKASVLNAYNLGSATGTLCGDGSSNIIACSGAGLAALSTANTWSTAGASGTPTQTFNGALYAGSTPFFLWQPSGTTAASSWNGGGTWLGFNAATGFTGNFLDFHLSGGASLASINYQGIGTFAALVNNGVLSMSSSAVAKWNNSAGFDLAASGIMEVDNGTAGNANGSLKLAGLYMNGGTKFTTSGCSVSATTGGATSGTLTLGANSCTVVVTMNGAIGLTAPDGWQCDAHDRTAPSVLIGGESASSTTTASFTIPAGAGTMDVISFNCRAY